MGGCPGVRLAWLAAPHIVHAVAAAHRAERCRSILVAVPEEWLHLPTGEGPDHLPLSVCRAHRLVRQYVAGVPGEMVGVRVGRRGV